MANTHNGWQSEPAAEGFYWARGLEETDVIVEATNVSRTSDSDVWEIKRHGRTANKALEELPRKVRFQFIEFPKDVDTVVE